jgi:hypothetical protein
MQTSYVDEAPFGSEVQPANNPVRKRSGVKLNIGIWSAAARKASPGIGMSARWMQVLNGTSNQASHTSSAITITAAEIDVHPKGLRKFQ